MDRKPAVSAGKQAALAVALFAITLNFLQPLVHAALLHDGATGALWSMFCRAAVADPDNKAGQSPVVAEKHECCLGLAHAQVGGEPSTAFIAIEPPAVVVARLQSTDRPLSGKIRDGPNQPRGPPSPVV
ncbi:MAG: hypothetical protein KIT25_04495 [Enhydrobacter sp.]|nr:MAG: hypothetical protein KIT25_04495 [Enhydrobacter sp.]